jgi:hypothetical protein
MAVLTENSPKRKARTAYERVLENLREIDFLWHLDDAYLNRKK